MNKDEIIKILKEIIADFEDGWIANPRGQTNRNNRENQLKRILSAIEKLNLPD